MKNITARDKRDFKEINNIIESVDEETRIYIMGYVRGLCERRNIPISTNKRKK